MSETMNAMVRAAQLRCAQEEIDAARERLLAAVAVLSAVGGEGHVENALGEVTVSLARYRDMLVP